MSKAMLPEDSGADMARSAILRTVVLIFLLLLILEAFLQYAHNLDVSYEATDVLVTNIQEILVKNEESIATLSDTLKEEYRNRVQSTAYALYLAGKSFSVADFQAMAQAMFFDEIHIFDRAGQIVNGNLPKYWGMTLDSGEQMAFFKPILQDYDLVLCQDVTPNTAEGKSMMYAMCWLPDHLHLVQIGITPQRLLAEIERNSSAGLAAQIPIADEGVFFAVADCETQALISTSDTGLIVPEESLFQTLFGPLADSGSTQYRCTLAGSAYYVSGSRFQNRYIVAAQSIRTANQGLGTSTLILSVALLFGLCFINLVQHRFARTEAQQRVLLQASNEALVENNDIIACANIGIWHIILLENRKPRMKANPKMRELMALPEDMTDEEDIYRFWYDRIAPEALASVEASTSQMMAGEQSENTYRWVHPVLGAQYVRCGGTALKVQTGYILRGYHYNVNEAILREREHERKMTQALHDAEQASIAKTTFLNHMSHDIRTPMNAIIGYTNIAKKQNESPAVAACLEKIGTSSDHLLSLINDVLDISRIESGKTKFLPAPVDLRRVIGDILSIARGSLEGRELTLQEDWQIPQPYVCTDALRIREIILNLLSNAIKFTPDGGTITFRLRMNPQADGSFLTQITVSDTGIGMSEDFQAHIFEEFSQENEGARTQYKGTGLGMPIVKRYLELMGGTIRVQSHKGQGTTFFVSVPMAQTQPDNLPQTASGRSAVTLSGKRVLLAEDNELNAEIARYLLEELGMKVTHVPDGAQAVEAFLSRPEDFDLILMDIMMPVMNGYEATQAIRRQGGALGRAIPILAVTANSFAEDIQSSLAAGMNGHISKPIQPKTLEEALTACLGG